MFSVEVLVHWQLIRISLCHSHRDNMSACKAIISDEQAQMWGCKLSRAIEAVKWKLTRDLSSSRRAVILHRKLWGVDKHPALPSSIMLVLLTGSICGSRTENCVLQTWWLEEGVLLLHKTSLMNVLSVYMCINLLLEMSEGKLNPWLLSNEVNVGLFVDTQSK